MINIPEIDIDMSKCLFIFSYNEENKILRDRMYVIETADIIQKIKLFFKRIFNTKYRNLCLMR